MELKYEVEDRIIAELLGIQNFTNKESAILELVKNSYDANATDLKIIYKNNKIIFIDNGKGMSEKDMKIDWMHIGRSDKKEKYFFNGKNGEKRIYLGSKGIGRFALARLGKEVSISSYNGNDFPVNWTTNWESTNLITLDEKIDRGTKIVINNLRDKWDEIEIKKLINFLSRVYQNEFMKITVNFNGKEIEVYNQFIEPKIGINYLSKISFNYISDEKKIYCRVFSDEFREEASEYYEGNINNYESTIDLSIEKKLTLNEEKIYREVGDFKGEFLFKILSSEKEADRFLYKYARIPEPYNIGIILYRNDFSIASYDGTKDWIGLGKRSRKSPAAATHPTGSWRVRENNLSGKVEIDRNKNSMLKDLSNRQGIEENEHYEAFLDIIHEAISFFENYRQGIIRAINKKNEELFKENEEFKIIKNILKKINIIHCLDQEDRNNLVIEIKKMKDLKDNYKVKLDESTKEFKYNEKILSVFSTLGLKISSVAHDIKNDRNNLVDMADYIEEALKKHNVWEILNREENKKKTLYNIPKLLVNTKRYSQKINILMNNILKNVRKSQFELKKILIYDLINEIKDEWMKDYGMINIKLDINKEISLITSEDIFKVIFDNLILNSYQQNIKMEKIDINIKIIELEPNKLSIIYEDNGIGLDKKYLSNPNRILIPHETTRKDGHGLGMWIVNNTILKTEGYIIKIGNSNTENEYKGFYIEFILKGEK